MAPEKQDRIREAMQTLRAALHDWPAGEIERFVERQFDDFWLIAGPSVIERNARFLRRVTESRLAIEYNLDTLPSTTEMIVAAPDHPRLLSILAGACATCSASIMSAHITTTRDGIALDAFALQREYDSDNEERRRVEWIGHTTEKLLKGEVWFDTLMKQAKTRRATSHGGPEPEITIAKDRSDDATVITIKCPDRPGLLYDVTRTMADMRLNICLARIETQDDRASGEFFVTDLSGHRLDSVRQRAIFVRLMTELGVLGT